MNDLSLKGVARKYRQITGSFSVVNDIFGIPAVSGSVSLRAQLESLAQREVSIYPDPSECIFQWTSRYMRTWSHVIVRIRLAPDAGITAETLNDCKATWEAGIENTWSHRWACAHDGELPCRLSFDVQWVTAGEHQAVRVVAGTGQTVMDMWHTVDGGDVAAHEFGHMLGCADEYVDPQCPNRSPVSTGTVMDNNSNNVPSRLVERFANSLDCYIAPL